MLSVVFVHTFDLGVSGVGWASFGPAETGTAVSPSALAIVLALMDLGPKAEPRAAYGRAWRLARMIAVNRDIMIRSFTLLFAFTFFTARECGSRRCDPRRRTRSCST